MNNGGEQLIINGSFDGLLDRIAKIDFFDVWLTGRKILKKAKKERVEATMWMSEVSRLTGLTREDIEFFISLRLIECVGAGDDPPVSFKDVFCLVKIFGKFADDENISQKRLSKP